MIYAIVGILAVILDQYVKYWVAGNILIDTGIKEFIPGVVSLVNIHNTGAAFGILSGSNSRILFIAVCIIFTLLVIVAIAANWISGSLGRWSAVLVVAGGIGNCIDRVLYGYVQDMFSLEFMDFAIFNVADIFITVFCVVFIFYILFGGEGKRSRDRREMNAYGIEDEDEYEEEAAPRRSRRGRTYEDDYSGYEEEEPQTSGIPNSANIDYAQEAQPHEQQVQKSFYSSVTGKPSRKERQSAVEDEYEQFKAQRAERIRQMQEKDAIAGAAAVRIPSKPAQKTVASDDPFAEWERANAASSASSQPTPPLFSAAEASAYAQPVAAQPSSVPASVSTSQPVAPAPAKSKEDFDIDDILKEFDL